jgi:hypothetical protein
MHFLQRSSASLLAIFGASLIQSTHAALGPYNYSLVLNTTKPLNTTGSFNSTNWNSTSNHTAISVGTTNGTGIVTINNGTAANDTSANQTRAPSNEYGYGTKHYRRDGAPADFFAVTGPKANGSVPLRREIRDLQKDTTMWTLYILALDMLQYTNQSDLLSWYQIGGIHGEPFVPWDNVQPLAGNEQNGYCHHSSILFPTWHRPYLALFEVSSPLLGSLMSMH